ncbi:uncharacterized protein METZ01_LOCUS250499, partial [marine metagenome]
VPVDAELFMRNQFPYFNLISYKTKVARPTILNI